MAFQEIERGTFYGKAALQNTVRVKAHKGTAWIIISNDIFAKIGAPNFLRVMTGTGEHKGFIAIIPRNMPSSGTYRPTVNSKGRGYARLTISAKRLSIPSGITAAALPFEITEDGLIVDLRQLAAKPALVA